MHSPLAGTAQCGIWTSWALNTSESPETFLARLEAAIEITESVWWLFPCSRKEVISERGMHPHRDTSTVIFGDMIGLNSKLWYFSLVWEIKRHDSRGALAVSWVLKGSRSLLCSKTLALKEVFWLIERVSRKGSSFSCQRRENENSQKDFIIQ